MKNSESFKSHDKHGTELKVGDLVSIEAKVVDATIQNAGSDLVLETVEPSPAGDKTIIRLASRQVALAGGPPAADAAKATKAPETETTAAKPETTPANPS